MVMTRKGTFYIFWTETSQFTIDFTFFTSYIFYRGWCKHNLINVVIEISINPRNDNLIICQYRGRFCPVVLFPLYVFFVFFCIFFFYFLFRRLYLARKMKNSAKTEIPSLVTSKTALTRSLEFIFDRPIFSLKLFSVKIKQPTQHF